MYRAGWQGQQPFSSLAERGMHRRVLRSALGSIRTDLLPALKPGGLQQSLEQAGLPGAAALSFPLPASLATLSHYTEGCVRAHVREYGANIASGRSGFSAVAGASILLTWRDYFSYATSFGWLQS